MSYVDKSDLASLYKRSTDEKTQWQQDYPTFERLMNNDLMEGLDPSLPEVNDGSLAAALFKLPKRIVPKNLSGTVKALDRDEAWMSVLANMIWQNKIVPNANTQAPFVRKWKDAVRKAAGYGGVPLITIFTERNGEDHTDFIVAQPQDVTLEAGKISDADCDVIFWDVFFSDSQVKDMIEQAKDDKESTWDVQALKSLLAGKRTEQKTTLNRENKGNNPVPYGYKFVVAFQRGVEAPFCMYHADNMKQPVREWKNEDPTGDLPIHYLYCYQDFVNPYGIGIVKLAGGTQNVLDYMRQADVLATQLGLRPPIKVMGSEGDVDPSTFVYEQDAIWYTNNIETERQELADGVYSQLPERMSMYKTSLNQLIPTGDTSIQAGAGDPQYSKTPAGVKFQQASLSIDDEDFKDNLYITFEAVARSMINVHFANMEGKDLMKLSDDERDQLMEAGIEFPVNAQGEVTNQLEMAWDKARAEFDFEVDPDVDKAKDDQQKLEGLMHVAELVTNPNMMPLMSGQPIVIGNKKLNGGELLSEIIGLTSDNDKILTDATPDEVAENQVMNMQLDQQQVPQ